MNIRHPIPLAPPRLPAMALQRTEQRLVRGGFAGAPLDLPVAALMLRSGLGAGFSRPFVRMQHLVVGRALQMRGDMGPRLQ
jgi:hypothetical protein